MPILFKFISDICTIRTGNKDVNEGSENGIYPFFTCAAEPLKSNTYSFEGESILLPGNGANVGLVLYYDGKFELYQRTYVLNNFKDVFVRYVYYFLKKVWKSYNNNLQYGSATNYIRFDNISKLKIFLPPLFEQKQIVEILDKADSIRQKRKQAINLLDEYLHLTFLEIFGDPVKNEKNWDLIPIHDLVRQPTINGLYIPNERYSKEGIEMVHMSDGFYGKIIRGNLKRVNLTKNEIQKYNLTKNDVLIARRSLNYEGAAKICLVTENAEPLVFESSFIRVPLDINKILPLYLFFFFNNKKAKEKYVLKYITKSTISGINQTNLNKIKILVPPIILQNHFAEIVQKVDSLKFKMQESLKEMDNHFNSLLNKFFYN